MEPEIKKAARWSEDNILDLIRKIRNDLIKDFLDERHLKYYLSEHYGIKDISLVKVEFIKAALKELLMSPVNTNHYRHLIEHIMETDTASLSEGNDDLFYKEIERILKLHIF